MSKLVAEAYSRLTEDKQRESHPFSEDLKVAADKLIAAKDDAERAAILSDWMKVGQPCLFGKISAAKELIGFAFIVDDDLRASDTHIADKIRAAREAFKHKAMDGHQSAFVILAISKSLQLAEPNDQLKEFAIALARAYLRRHVEPDKVLLDTVELWNTSYSERRRWGVGANFFAAAGDQRWWHDHRIPGGVGFSMNSIGHLVASEARRRAILDAGAAVRAGTISGKTAKRVEAQSAIADLEKTPITTPEIALQRAMHTIQRASEQSVPVNGCSWAPATMLLKSTPPSRCPFAMVNDDPELADKDWNTYAGWYHTDITIPSDYFRPDWERPRPMRSPFALDFSYLHKRSGAAYGDLIEGRVVAATSQPPPSELDFYGTDLPRVVSINFGASDPEQILKTAKISSVEDVIRSFSEQPRVAEALVHADLDTAVEPLRTWCAVARAIAANADREDDFATAFTAAPGPTRGKAVLSTPARVDEEERG